MITYDKAKEQEDKVTEYYEDKFLKYDSEAKRIIVNQYDYSDLIMFDSKGKYHCLEVKYRRFDKAFHLREGVMVDYDKLIHICNKFNVKYFTLITLTSDGFYFKTKIDSNCYSEMRKLPKKSCFGAKEYIEKRVILTKNHEEIGYTSELDKHRVKADWSKLLSNIQESEFLKFKKK